MVAALGVLMCALVIGQPEQEQLASCPLHSRYELLGLGTAGRTFDADERSLTLRHCICNLGYVCSTPVGVAFNAHCSHGRTDAAAGPSTNTSGFLPHKCPRCTCEPMLSSPSDINSDAVVPTAAAWSHVSITNDVEAGCVKVAAPKGETWTLWGRLSGKSLHLLTWHQEGALQVGCYTAQFAGQYFLEVLVLLTEPPLPYPDRKRQCLVSPTSWTLTARDATVRVAMATKAAGWWGATESSGAVSGLVTRYQPQGCRGAGDQSARCRDAMSLDRFEPYAWMWETPPPILPVFPPNTHWTAEPSGPTIPCRFGDKGGGQQCPFSKGRVCVLGASHGSVLVNALAAIQIPAHFYPAEFAAHVAGGGSSRFGAVTNFTQMKECKTTILTFGQWDAGKPGQPPHYNEALGYPTPTVEYVKAYEVLLDALEQRYGFDMSRVIVINTHYNPPGDLITACPPKDWRSIPVIDEYNKFVRAMCARRGIDFIDTRDIIGPVWDSGADLNHYHGQAGVAEAEYVRRYIQKRQP
jgi:hypothetical protein